MEYKGKGVYKKPLLDVSLYLGTAFVFLILLDKVLMPLITKGGDEITIPNVIGKTYDEAFNVLKQKELEAKRGYDLYDAKSPIGVVVAQNPLSGSDVKKGRHVYLSVNVEREAPAVVPNLVGKSLQEAKELLITAKLEIGEVYEETAKSIVEDEKIIWQSIVPFRSVKKQTKVNLKFAKAMQEGKEKVFSVPEVIGIPLDEGIERMKEIGFVDIQVTKVYSKSIIESTILEQNPSPFEIAKLNKKIHLTISSDKK
ncbi:hypothetical protein CHS0354_024003 [Potamilus streckersoni]|uniref:PASTA domain-containing protein n=1 Tax=Potamilus streckersoni TaxID=2493646 RepID=A0AAE0RZ81_9BIVA|nr:hypothetical protein CHS0354_024003 [Potamilus streckersoni]